MQVALNLNQPTQGFLGLRPRNDMGLSSNELKTYAQDC